MSTYKSLGGPPGGVIITNDAEIAQKIDCIAFPGMTANFDAAKSAALAVTMLDWKEFGREYAAEMVLMAKTLASSLEEHDIPVFFGALGHTQSHQFAVLAEEYGGGQQASKPVDEPLRNAASMVLDVHDKSAVIGAADDLLNEINTKGINKPNINNQSLEMKPMETSMTSRKDPTNIMGKNNNAALPSSKSVPLPNTETEDDLDF